MVKQIIKVMKLDNKQNKESGVQDNNGVADYEAAISATQYGKFHIILLLLTIPCALSIQFDAVLMSYILPSAECDLNLTLGDKGIINGMTFLGMIISGPLWGFLLDTIGRRKMLIFGSFLLFLVHMTLSLAQTFEYLTICKFFGGCLSGGVYVACVTYLQEFHSIKYRGRMQMACGSTYCIGNLILPVMSSYFLPLKFHVSLFNYLEFRQWNLFIFVSSFSSLICTIVFYFLPESPKYLMSTGENEPALEVFQKVYAVNTGKSVTSYPIFKLIEEKPKCEQCKRVQGRVIFREYVQNGIQQIAPLFKKTYLVRLSLFCTVLPIIQMTLIVLRTWFPQIFQSIYDYQVNNNDTTADLCTMMSVFQKNHNSSSVELVLDNQECSVNLEDNFSVYLNSMVVAAVAFVGFTFVGVLINLLGQKPLIVLLGISSSIFTMLLYVSNNTISTLALASLSLATLGISFDVVMVIMVAAFPTTLRGTAISLTLLIGRSLCFIGNLVFPTLLETSCAAPFFTFGGFLIVSSLISTLLPNTKNVRLE